jgi:hypothetical protein
MPKKPTLKIVVNSAPADAGAPPPNLGQAGGNLWRSIMREYKVEDFGGFEMLTQICKALDRAESCAEEIENDGPVIRSKGGGIKEHPLLKIELASRSFVVRSLHRLGLDIEPTRSVVGRPPVPRVR